MEKNVGGMDRTLRLVIGTLLALAGAAGYAGLFRVAFGPFPQALTSVVLVLVGLVLLATGITQKCHINKLLGMNTYEK